MSCASTSIASDVIIILNDRLSGGYIIAGEDKSDTNMMVDAVSIKSLWESCESLDEAKVLTEYMISHPSLDWVPIMDEAQKGNIKHGRALLDRDDEFYESVADLIADQDGLVYVPKEKNP